MATTGQAFVNSGIFHCLPFNSSALNYLQTPTRRYGHASTPPQFLPISGHRNVSLPPSLEWHVWSSSSGNNCHAVHRSLSSGTSLCDGTVGFFTFSHIVSQAVFYSRFFDLLFRYQRGWAEKFIRWHHISCLLTFRPIRSNLCSSDGISMKTARETMM